MQQTLSLLSRYQCCLETSAGLAEDELVVRMLITVPIKIFHSYGDVIAFGKGLQLGAHSHRPVRFFFSVLHILWHMISDLRLVTFTPATKHLKVELSLYMFKEVCRSRDSKPNFLHARRTLY